MIAKDINDLLGRMVTRKDLYLKKVVIKDGVENICGHCLCRIKRMTSIIIPNSVVSIEPFAFWGCHNLTALEIPESVKNISPFAFRGCESLKSIKVNKLNLYYDSREECNAIINTKDNTLILGCDNSTIPTGTKRIKSGAFRDCHNIESIRIPESLHNVLWGLPCVDKVTTIVVDKNNTFLDSRDNCNSIIRKRDNSLLYGCNNSTIPEGVETINVCAFAGCKGLKSVVIPSSVKTICKGAFRRCSNLTSITMPNSIISIEKGAFQYCSKSLTFYIPKGSKEKFETLLPHYSNNFVEL